MCLPLISSSSRRHSHFLYHCPPPQWVSSQDPDEEVLVNAKAKQTYCALTPFSVITSFPCALNFLLAFFADSSKKVFQSSSESISTSLKLLLRGIVKANENSSEVLGRRKPSSPVPPWQRSWRPRARAMMALRPSVNLVSSWM